MKKILALSVLLALPFVADYSQAGTCRNAINEASNRIFNKGLGTVCAGVDTGVKANSPFIYVNPDAGCDIGLQMPGLPTFGAKVGDGLNLCNLAKTVFGGMVDAVNTEARNKMDQAVGTINKTAQDAIGTNVLNNEVDLSTILQQKTNQAAQGATPSYVPY